MTDDAWHRITTKTEYLVKCADVRFGDAEGSSVATTEGEIFGEFGGQKLQGTWDWDGGFFTRTSTLGDLDLGSDSIVIEVTATKMRLTMQKGEGPQVVYDRKDAPLSPTADGDEIVFLSSFKIKPEGIEGFTAAMIDNQINVRAETGSLEMRLFQGQADKGVFFVFGRTAGRAGLEEHLISIEERGIAGETMAALAEPPIARHLGAPIQEGVFGPQDHRPGADELIAAAVFDLKPGTRDAVIAQYERQVPNVRQAPGCLVFNAWPVLGNPNQLAILERWETVAAGQAFSTTDPLSIETGALLAASVEGTLSDFIIPLREIEPYS